MPKEPIEIKEDRQRVEFCIGEHFRARINVTIREEAGERYLEIEGTNSIRIEPRAANYVRVYLREV